MPLKAAISAAPPLTTVDFDQPDDWAQGVSFFHHEDRCSDDPDCGGIGERASDDHAGVVGGIVNRELQIVNAACRVAAVVQPALIGKACALRLSGGELRRTKRDEG